jgi:hypothetical protein
MSFIDWIKKFNHLNPIIRHLKINEKILTPLIIKQQTNKLYAVFLNNSTRNWAKWHSRVRRRSYKWEKWLNCVVRRSNEWRKRRCTWNSKSSTWSRTSSRRSPKLNRLNNSWLRTRPPMMPRRRTSGRSSRNSRTNS